MEAASRAIGAASSTAPVALLVADVDHFRSIADAFGGAAAQSVLDQIEELVRCDLRAGDCLTVPQGDELLVLLRTSAAEALHVAERLCAAVRGHDFGAVPVLNTVTISAGIAGAPEHGADFASLHAAADAARVRLKAHGRDGASLAPLAHRDPLHRPLDIDRFAGRVEEMRTLRALLDESIAGRPRVVAVSGEAGSGTARLLRQLAPEVRLRGGAFVEARAQRGPLREPYGVWISVLDWLRRLPGAPVRSWRELSKLVPALGGEGATVDDARPGSKYLLHEELIEYLRLSAGLRPIMIVLEQMQWAEEESWEAFEYVVQQLDTERLLLCLSMRTDAAYAEAAERRHALARHEIFRELTLSRLTREEVKRWLESAFHHQDIGREFLAFLYRHTEGNPLFIAELLRTLAEEGVVWHSGQRWEWSPVSELRLPTGLAALITHRLHRFPSSTLAVLSTAAIIGHEFDLALVVASGAGSEGAVQLALSEALDSGLIVHTHERAEGRFAFAHTLVADALVEMVAPEQLRQLHGRVAAAMERRGAAHVAEIALHYDLAGAQGSAYRHALRAADRSERLNAHAAAGEFLQAAARNATSPGELAEVRIRLANLAEAAGRYDEVEELCDLAIQWLQSQGEQRRALTLRRMRERARRELGQPARVTLEALLALDAEAKESGFASERISIMMMLSQTHGLVGDSAAEQEIAEECVRMAESLGEAALLPEALQRLARAIQANPSAENSLERARALHRRALELFRAAGDVRGQASALNNLGIVALHESRWDEAREALTSSIALSRSAGSPDLWARSAINLGVMNQNIGEFDRARELFGEALALSAAIKNTHAQLIALYDMAHVERESGASAAACELYEATVSLAKRIGLNEIEIGATAATGLCHLDAGRTEDARTAAGDVEERMRTRTGWFQGRELVEALRVRMSLSDGDIRGAVEAFERAMPLADASDLYTAAWLTAACAPSLFEHEPILVKEWIRRYADRVESLGYAEMSKRYLDLLAR